MKKILIALGVACVPLAGYLYQQLKENSSPKDKRNRRYVGIELGGTNYNVALAEPVFNNKGEIVDFNIIKRRNGNTFTDPTQTLYDIIDFISANQQSGIQ